MKKTLLLCGALLAISATVASAAGLNLSWLDCGTEGVTNRNGTCGTSGSNRLIASVIAPQQLDRFVGIDVVMDLQTASSPLPAWWDLRAGVGCRPTALSMSTDFSTTTSEGGACTDIFQAQGGGGVGAYNIGFGGPNRARIVAFWAVPDERVLTTNETYMFQMNISNTGTASCAGCQDPACIVLNLIRLAQPAGAGDFEVTNPANANYVTWFGGTPGCPGTVPAKNATWGQVKSLYR
jgi:hypothetical protein